MGAGQAMDPNLAGEFPARYTHPLYSNQKRYINTNA